MNDILNITENRIDRPNVYHNMVKRNKILNNLLLKRQNLIVLHAPSGYGKTVLMEEYSYESSIYNVWYSVENFDNDMLKFSNTLFESVQKIFSEVKILTEPIEEEYDYKKLAYIFSKMLMKINAGILHGKQMNILLDNFQEVKEENIFRFLSETINYLPVNIKICIGTSGENPLALLKHVLTEKAVYVKSSELAFNEEEIAELMRIMRYSYYSKTILSKTYEYTKGWPAGVKLLLIYLEKHNYSDFNINSHEVFRKAMLQEYVENAIFKKIPKEYHKFLIQIAVLDRIDVDICTVITKERNAKWILEQLIKREMFIEKPNENPDNYEYHHLFRVFLLTLISNQEKIKLYYKIAKQFTFRENNLLAVKYAFKTNNIEFIEGIIKRVDIEESKIIDLNEFNDLIEVENMKEKIFDISVPKMQLLTGVYYKNKGDLEKANIYFSRSIFQSEILKEVEIYFCGVIEKIELLMENQKIRDAEIELNRLLNIIGDDVKKEVIAVYYRIVIFMMSGNLEEVVSMGNRIIELINTLENNVNHGYEKKLSIITIIVDLLSNQNNEKYILDSIKTIGNIPIVVRDLYDYQLLNIYINENSIDENIEMFERLLRKVDITIFTAVGFFKYGLYLFENKRYKESGEFINSGFELADTYGEYIFYFLSTAEYDKCNRINLVGKNNESFDNNTYHVIADCFGNFKMTVLETGEEIKWRTRKAKECMAYFLHRSGEVITREELLSILWNAENLPDNEVAALHNILSSIRKNLKSIGVEDLIKYEQGYYVINRSIVFSIKEKLDKFTEYVSKENWEMVEKYEGWIYHYKGSYFNDVGSVWCLEQREYYECKMLKAFQVLAKRYFESDNARKALVFYKKILDREPCDEKILERILLCYGKLKEVHQIKFHYKKFKKSLESELGMKPNDKISKIYDECIKMCINNEF